MRQRLSLWSQLLKTSQKCLTKDTSFQKKYTWRVRSYATDNANSPLDALTAPSHPGALLAFHSDKHEVPLDEKHRFPMSKYRLTRLALEADPSIRGLIETREVDIHLGWQHMNSQLLHTLSSSCARNLQEQLTANIFFLRHHLRQRRNSLLRMTQLMYSGSSMDS